MKMVLIRRFFVLLMVGLFLAISIVPVSSFDIGQLSSKSDEGIDSNVSFNSSCPYIVADIDNDKKFPEREDFERDLHERYTWQYDQHLRSNSDYLYDKPFYHYPDYADYGEFKDARRYDSGYVKNHTLKNRTPTPKPNFANGKTWYVNDDNIDGPWGGSIEHPFQHIQDGIDASENGDTVFVYSGTYYENVIVDKSIYLEGEDRDTTIIDGGGNGDVVYVSADWIKINGFTVNASGDHFKNSYYDAGIYICSNYNNISDNIISNNYFRGIYLSDSSNNTISMNTINNNRLSGIELSFSKNNRIIKNFFIDNLNGIYISSSPHSIITDNTFNSEGISIHGEKLCHWNTHTIVNNKANNKPIFYYSNNHEQITVPYNSSQVILANCSNFIIKNLNISYVNTGIQLGYSFDNIIYSNNIKNNERDGIFLQKSWDNTITFNNISNNTLGIELIYSSNNVISYNNFTDYNYYALLLQNSSYNNFIGNNITDIMSFGIYIFDNSIHNTISGNTISCYWGISCYSNNTIIHRNTFINSGLKVSNSYENIISENIVNGKPLIYLEKESNKIILDDAGQIILVRCDNIIIQNQELVNTIYGIILCDTDYCLIRNNELSNVKRGIYLDSSNYNTISNNNISDNGFGFLLFNSINNIIEDNNISSNLEGIECVNSNNNFVKNNIINSNEWGGIFLWDSYNITLLGNIIKYNKNKGMMIWDSSIDLLENIIHSNRGDGICFDNSCNNNTITGNIIYSNKGRGLCISQSNNVISENEIINNVKGIELDSFTNNTIFKNTFINDGLTISGNSYNNNIFDNEVNGKPLIYLEGESDKIIGDAGQVILFYCDNITVQNQHISNTTRGIHLYFTCNSSILGNIIDSNNDDGIHLELLSSNNIISLNTIMDNKGNGIFLRYGTFNNEISDNHYISNNKNGIRLSDSYNKIINCTISLNFQDGIMVDNSYNIVTNCSISSNFRYGIRIEDSSSNILSNCTIENHRTISSSSGIYLVNSDNTLIENCCISNNKNAGLEIDLLSTGTNIAGCLLKNNHWGVFLSSSSSNRIRKCTISNNDGAGICNGRDNTIYKNNFIDNYNHYLHGGWDDSNVFYRNYWSGHFTPLPYRVFNKNYDMFPRAIPYILPLLEILLDNPSDRLLNRWRDGR